MTFGNVGELNLIINALEGQQVDGLIDDVNIASALAEFFAKACSYNSYEYEWNSDYSPHTAMSEALCLNMNMINCLMTILFRCTVG